MTAILLQATRAVDPIQKQQSIDREELCWTPSSVCVTSHHSRRTALEKSQNSSTHWDTNVHRHTCCVDSTSETQPIVTGPYKIIAIESYDTGYDLPITVASRPVHEYAIVSTRHDRMEHDVRKCMVRCM